VEGASTSGAPLTQRKHPAFVVAPGAWLLWEYSQVPGRLDEVVDEAFFLPASAVRMVPRILGLGLWDLGCTVRGHRVLIVGSWSADEGWRTVYCVHELCCE